MPDRALSHACVAAALGLAAAALAPPGVARAEAALCHYDDPAPYVRFLETAERGAPEPGCAERASAQEAPEELILPMPCGHRMHFRRIDLGVRDPLDHRTVHVGDANAAARSTLNRASSIPREDKLSGSFFRPDPETGGEISYFYIGKYEVTAPQWALYEAGLFERGLAVVGGNDPACQAHVAEVREAHRPQLVLPATRVTWVEANAFAHAFTLWLLTIDRALVEQGNEPLLPWQDGSTGFLRLPSDTEWEFAARGGLAYATREALSRALYPVERDGALVDPTLGQIAQTDGLDPPLQFANGIGKRAPNPLGLYDTLGNVEEVVLDFFRPTRPDGLKGQLGGVVLRGGSTVTDETLIGLGYRQEAPLYDHAGAVRSASVGTRLAVAAPFFVGGAASEDRFAKAGLANEAQFADIETALAQLSGTGAGARAGTPATEADFFTRAETAALAPEAAALVTEARGLVEKNYSERVQAEQAALAERFIGAATLLLGTDRTGANVLAAVQKLHSNLMREGLAPELRDRVVDRLPEYMTLIRQRAQEVDAMFAAYVENVSAILKADETDRLIAQRSAEDWVDTREAPRLQRAMEQTIAHLTEALDGPGTVTETMRASWLDEVDSYRGDRERMVADLREELP